MDVRSILRRAANYYARQPAVVVSGKEYTFEECWRRGLRCHNGLRSIGLLPGDRVGVLDDNFIEALEFLQKLFDAGVIRPVNMTAEGNADYCGTPGATFDKGVEVAITPRALWQMGTLNQNNLDWGIVPYPWGSGVTFGTPGDINTIEGYHSMYYDAGITGSVLAGVEVDFPGMEKDYVIEALTHLTYDLFFTEERQADIAAMAAPDYEPDLQMDPFPSMVDAEIYQWMKERIIFNPIAMLNLSLIHI